MIKKLLILGALILCMGNSEATIVNPYTVMVRDNYNGSYYRVEIPKEALYSDREGTVYFCVTIQTEGQISRK